MWDGWIGAYPSDKPHGFQPVFLEGEKLAMYTRIFTKILDSSLNVQTVPVCARWLWVTMLIIGDEDGTGIVDMPVERLAARAGLSVEETRTALDLLGSPDQDSRSDKHEGRRIVPISDNPNRGWEIVNWAEYKAIANKEHEKHRVRLAVAEHRKKRKVTDGNKK